MIKLSVIKEQEGIDGDILGLKNLCISMPGGGSNPHRSNLYRVDVSHRWNSRYGYLEIH